MVNIIHKEFSDSTLFQTDEASLEIHKGKHTCWIQLMDFKKNTLVTFSLTHQGNAEAALIHIAKACLEAATSFKG